MRESNICALASLSKSLLTIALVILFLGDLLNLVKELTHSQLQLIQFVFGSNLFFFQNISSKINLFIILCMLSHLDVQMHSQLGSTEPSRRIGVKTNQMFARRMARKGPHSLTGIKFTQNHL